MNLPDLDFCKNFDFNKATLIDLFDFFLKVESCGVPFEFIRNYIPPSIYNVFLNTHIFFNFTSNDLNKDSTWVQLELPLESLEKNA